MEELHVIAAEALRDPSPLVRPREIDAALRPERIPRVTEAVAVAVVEVVGVPCRRRQHHRDSLHRRRRSHHERREPDVTRRSVEPRGIEPARIDVERHLHRRRLPAAPDCDAYGIPDRHPPHLVVAVGGTRLGPAPQQRHPQPRGIGLHVQRDLLAGKRTAPPERRLDVHHANDSRAEDRGGCLVQFPQSKNVGAGLDARFRRPRDLVAPGGEGHRLPREDANADAVAVHDLERGVDATLGEQIDHGAASRASAARADRREVAAVADERLRRVPDREPPDHRRRTLRIAGPACDADVRRDRHQRPAEETLACHAPAALCTQSSGLVDSLSSKSHGRAVIRPSFSQRRGPRRWIRREPRCPGRSSGAPAILDAMRLVPGYVDGSVIVHLTHTTLSDEALCGEAVVDVDGEPDLAIVCEECDRIGREAGRDQDEWARLSRTLTLVDIPARVAAESRAA